jgi:L-amino acid N-acyltransferase YncA
MNNEYSITVRFACKKDLEECLAMDGSDRADIISNKIEMHEIIVAERAGELIGYLRIEYLWARLPFISLITLKPEYRKKGIGSLMLRYLTEFLEINGFDVLLSSSQVNEAEPQQWHRSKGFVECGMLAGMNENGIGEVFFKLNLSKEA